MSHRRENSNTRRRSAGPGDELHVVTGSSGTSVENLRSGDLQDGRGDVRVQNQQGQALVKGQKASPEMSFYIGIPQGEGNVEQDDSDPPVENFALLQYDEEDDECDDDDDDDESFQPLEDDDPDRLEHSRVNCRRGGRRGGGPGNTRFFRKRKKSGSHGGNDANYVPPYKKRYGRQNSVLPSKFLLGGNIRDPLNLASLADARVNAESNAETPKSSPLPLPLYKAGEVPVFIPKNPDDPLGLQTETLNPHDFIAGIRNNTAKGRKRHRKRTSRKRTDSQCSVDKSEYDSDTKVEKEAPASEEAKGSNNKVVENVFAEPTKREKVAAPTPLAAAVPEEKVSPDKPKPVEEKKMETTSASTEAVEEPKPSTSTAPQVNSAAKKKHRTRRRNNKKFNPGAMGQLLSNMFNRQTSDYVPLGTPSRAETSGWYQFGTPGRGSDHQYEYSGSPFQSPSLSKFYTDYIENDSHEHFTMEPFSPPPANEPKRRRVVEVAETETKEEDKGEEKSEVREKEDEDNDDDKFVKPEVPPPSKAFYRKRNHGHKVDPIVSPVVFQPGSRRRNGPHHHHGRKGHDDQKNEQSDFVYRRKDEKFQYGNYNRYYGYRSTGENDDLRLRAFTKEFFANKDVLDVGCNIGHVTLTIARDYGARMVRGIDIDPKLIEIAKKNVKHYVNRDPTDESVRFPKSCPLMFGMLQPPPANLGDTRSIPFPYNISFRHENYVLESDDLLKTVEPEYDVILCLSITKWIHLNNGDDGLKRFFRRTFLHLRPGGKLVLEPQPWPSYAKKKRLTETIYRNFKTIHFYPTHFKDYLLKEVGYATAEHVTSPLHHSKGFRRPLMIYTKPATVSVSSSTETITVKTMETESTATGSEVVVTSTKVVKFKEEILQCESTSSSNATATQSIISETRTELTTAESSSSISVSDKVETSVSDSNNTSA